MDETSCAATMAFGMEAIAGGTDLPGRRRDGHRQHHRRGGDLRRALTAARPRDWVGRGTGRRRRRPGAQARGRRRRRSPATPAISTIRWRCCAGSAAARSRRSRARSSPRACSAFRWCSTAMSRRPPRRCCTRSTRRARPLHRRPRLGRGRASEVLRAPRQVPLLALGMRLGEGTGRALAARPRQGGAAACHRGMATFGASRRTRSAMGRRSAGRATRRQAALRGRGPGGRARPHGRQGVHHARRREGDDHLGALARLRLQLEPGRRGYRRGPSRSAARGRSPARRS